MWKMAGLVGAFVAAASIAGAAGGGIGVEPGIWEFSSSLPDPSTGEMRRFTHRECVRDRLITPERVMARMKECRIWNARFQGPSAKWNMKCDTPAGPITGGGYANAATRKWVRAYVEKYGRLPEEARKSWPYPFVADLLGTVRPLTSQVEMFA